MRYLIKCIILLVLLLPSHLLATDLDKLIEQMKPLGYTSVKGATYVKCKILDVDLIMDEESNLGYYDAAGWLKKNSDNSYTFISFNGTEIAAERVNKMEALPAGQMMAPPSYDHYTGRRKKKKHTPPPKLVELAKKYQLLYIDSDLKTSMTQYEEWIKSLLKKKYNPDEFHAYTYKDMPITAMQLHEHNSKLSELILNVLKKFDRQQVVITMYIDRLFLNEYQQIVKKFDAKPDWQKLIKGLQSLQKKFTGYGIDFSVMNNSIDLIKANHQNTLTEEYLQKFPEASRPVLKELASLTGEQIQALMDGEANSIKDANYKYLTSLNDTTNFAALLPLVDLMDCNWLSPAITDYYDTERNSQKGTYGSASNRPYDDSWDLDEFEEESEKNEPSIDFDKIAPETEGLQTSEDEFSDHFDAEFEDEFEDGSADNFDDGSEPESIVLTIGDIVTEIISDRLSGADFTDTKTLKAKIKEYDSLYKSKSSQIEVLLKLRRNNYTYEEKLHKIISSGKRNIDFEKAILKKVTQENLRLAKEYIKSSGDKAKPFVKQICALLPELPPDYDSYYQKGRYNEIQWVSIVKELTNLISEFDPKQFCAALKSGSCQPRTDSFNHQLKKLLESKPQETINALLKVVPELKTKNAGAVVQGLTEFFLADEEAIKSKASLLLKADKEAVLKVIKDQRLAQTYYNQIPDLTIGVNFSMMLEAARSQKTPSYQMRGMMFTEPDFCQKLVDRGCEIFNTPGKKFSSIFEIKSPNKEEIDKATEELKKGITVEKLAGFTPAVRQAALKTIKESKPKVKKELANRIVKVNYYNCNKELKDKAKEILASNVLNEKQIESFEKLFEKLSAEKALYNVTFKRFPSLGGVIVYIRRIDPNEMDVERTEQQISGSINITNVNAAFSWEKEYSDSLTESMEESYGDFSYKDLRHNLFTDKYSLFDQFNLTLQTYDYW